MYGQAPLHEVFPACCAQFVSRVVLQAVCALSRGLEPSEARTLQRDGRKSIMDSAQVGNYLQ